MNLQSKFGYCIITQTLIIALCLQAGQNYRLADKQTIRLLDIPADLPCRGIGHVCQFNCMNALYLKLSNFSPSLQQDILLSDYWIQPATMPTYIQI